MFEFDEKLQTFRNLTEIQKENLKKEILDIVVNGKPNIDSVFFKAWTNHFGFSDTENSTYNNTRSLLLISTAYPQRALLTFI